MTWIMEVERTPATLKYFDALTRGELTAIVPAIWPEEISNVLLSVERSRKLTAAQAAIWIDVLKDIPIEVDQALIEESFGEVRLLAQAHGLTSYDARYLHLAIKQGVKLATRDKQLLAAAPKVGVKLVD
jgi:predicted nucleic acid-binding protein